MAKYSTGGVSSGESDACELCGAEGASLESANVAGAVLQVCPDCRRHGRDDRSSGGGRNRDSDTRRSGERDRKRRAVRNAARMADARKGDSTRWEQGTDYEDDPLPYLVRGYGDRLAEAREEAGLTAAELAGELGVREADVLAVEQGRATSAGIGGSLVAALEERLNVQLAQE
ncbi:helix-turn-helix domain-containing protein [Halomarina pelagica]|uniref:helix-turn-helix domain-containing protein n=1 Tax=Halomarina pelagica TaxID=2961599 RepID=UPI0020C4742B|nr:multiprotein-bridging factor 1 family protein [Halomarina sp. BND7]